MVNVYFNFFTLTANSFAVLMLKHKQEERAGAGWQLPVMIVLFYLFIQRQRKVTACALVQTSAGLKVVSVVPDVTLLSFAHFTAAA